MKHIVWKAYWDYEKEEKWLNELSAKGMALTDYSWCRYVFEETQKHEYTYRIELLKNMPHHPESIAYIRFLEESGVECVASYMRWLYLRKKTSEGSFEIFTDIDSRIKHFKQIYAWWNTLMFAELIIGLSNLTIGLINLNIGEKPVDFFRQFNNGIVPDTIRSFVSQVRVANQKEDQETGERKNYQGINQNMH